MGLLKGQMWKFVCICSCLLVSCDQWKEKPDGPVEEFVEDFLESAVRKGAQFFEQDVDIKIDFTPCHKSDTVEQDLADMEGTHDTHSAKQGHHF